MKVFLTAVGSGNTLNYPHNRNYSGIIGVIALSETYGENYKQENQSEIFDLKLGGTDYEILEKVKIEKSMSFYEVGSEVIKKIDELIKKNKSIKFHIETSASYKLIGHSLTFVSSLRRKYVSRLTFLDHNHKFCDLPIIEINLSKAEKEIFENYIKAQEKTPANNKISKNEFVLAYQGNKTYLYRILNKLKRKGLISDENKITDFGKLYLEFDEITK